MSGPIIDTEDYIPSHVQVNDSIKARIQGRAWVPGTRLPSEQNLCRQYNVSRTVVRQALLELELEGYVLRRRGRGTFVAEGKAKVLGPPGQGLSAFYKDIGAQGRSAPARLAYQRIVPAEAKPAHELDIEIGTPISEIRRILLVEGRPLAIVTSYLPEAHGQAPRNVDLTNPSLYDFVESESTIIVLCARLVIEAACVSETDASLLEISPGDPVMRLESTGYTSNGRPVEYFEAYHRGDRTRLHIRLVRRGSPWRVIE